MRRLDLRDYADLQSLILDAEDEGMGGYLLDLYNRVFQYELEADRPLAALAAGIDKIDWADYPPPHFLPAEDGMGILDNVMFYHEAAITDAEPTSLGDVLFRVERDEASMAHRGVAGSSPPGSVERADSDASQEGANVAGVGLPPAEAGQARNEGEMKGQARKEVPAVVRGKGELLALMVMTQACDVQRGSVGRYLLLPGVARPMDLQHHKRPGKLTTPVLRDGREREYVVEWFPETGAFTFTDSEMKQQIEEGTLRRVRRFRTVYALQLQQEFASNLTRVGTISVPPVRHAVGVTAYFRANNGALEVILAIPRRPERAVVLVGRDGNKEKHQFAMAPAAVADLRTAMIGVAPSTIGAFHPDVKSKWEKAVVGREVFRALEHGLGYSPDGVVRPFKGQEEDIIEVVGPFVRVAPKAGAQWSTKAQLVLHISSSDPSSADDDDNGAGDAGKVT